MLHTYCFGVFLGFFFFFFEDSQYEGKEVFYLFRFPKAFLGAVNGLLKYSSSDIVAMVPSYLL